MLENTTHRGRWHESPISRRPRTSILDRVRMALRASHKAEGRNRIDPTEAYGHWSAGYYDMKKAR